MEKNTEPIHHAQPHSSQTNPPSRRSSVSRVDVGFFDPEGVRELKRTLTAEKTKNLDPESRASTADSTLAQKQGDSFDFAKVLRETQQRYQISIIL